MTLEKFREKARVVAVQRAEKRRLLRYEQMHQQNTQVLEEQPVPPPPSRPPRRLCPGPCQPACLTWGP